MGRGQEPSGGESAEEGQPLEPRPGSASFYLNDSKNEEDAARDPLSGSGLSHRFHNQEMRGEDPGATEVFDIASESTVEQSTGTSQDFLVKSECEQGKKSSVWNNDALLQSIDAPKWIDGYRIINKVGEGGMGVVYLAKDAATEEGMVAIKVVKADLKSSSVLLARFETETNTISKMRHDGIAKVFDLGTTECGRPYFVMEFVDGISITKFCDKKKLTIQQRVRLFLDVCSPVDHAHQQEVVHRDLKPSNILVSQQEDAKVKIIDFGLAKEVGRQWLEDSFHTAHGQLVGTLEYMSPEQATAKNVQADCRSDVYSLGVVLYQLLCGSTPLQRSQIKSAGLMEVLERIKNEEPPTPSNRFRGTHNKKLCQQRSSDWKSIFRSIEGDLDWVVMKALEKEPSKRYETAHDFAEDLKNYLAGKPVNARPPSFCYKLTRVAKRNPVACMAAGTIVTLLFLGFVFASTFAIMARRNEARTLELLEETKQAVEVAKQQSQIAQKATQEAVNQRRKAEAALSSVRAAQEQADLAKNQSEELLNLFLDSFQNFDPATGRGHELLASDVLRTAYLKANVHFEKNPSGKARLMKTLSWAFFGLGNYSLGEKAGNESFQYYQKNFGASDLRTIDARLAIFWNLHAAGDFDQAESVSRQVVSVVQKNFDDTHPFVVRGLHARAMALHSVGQSQKAILILLNLIGSSERDHSLSPELLWKSKGYLAEIYQESGEPILAIDLLQELLPVEEHELGAVHKDVLLTKNRLAACLVDAGRLETGIKILKQVSRDSEDLFSKLHPIRISTRLNLGIAYRKSKQFEDADEKLSDLKSDLKNVPHFLSTFEADVNYQLGLLYLETNKASDAYSVLKTAAELSASNSKGSSLKGLRMQFTFAEAASIETDYQSSIPMLNGILESTSGDTRPAVVQLRQKSWQLLGTCFLDSKQFDKAIPAFFSAIKHSQKLSTAAQRNLASEKGGFGVAKCMLMKRRMKEAGKWFQSVQDSLQEEGADPKSIPVLRLIAECAFWRSRISEREGNLAETISLLEESIKFRVMAMEAATPQAAVEDALKASTALRKVASLLAMQDDVDGIRELAESGGYALKILSESAYVEEDQLLRLREVLGNIQILANEFEQGVENLRFCETVYFERFNFKFEALKELLRADQVCRTLCLTFQSKNQEQALLEAIERAAKYLNAAQFFVHDKPGMRRRLTARCKECIFSLKGLTPSETQLRLLRDFEDLVKKLKRDEIQKPN